MMLWMTTATSTSRPPQKWTFSESICWAVILVTVLLILVLHGATPAAQVSAADEKPDLQILLAGRYLVGVDRAIPKLAPGATTLPSTLAHSLDSRALTGPDQLAAAIVAGELEGKAAALFRLDAVDKNHPEMAGDTALLRARYDGQPLPAEWAAFHDRYGWFADLAASVDKPDRDPLRAEVLAHAMRTVLTMVAVGVFFLMAGAIGFALLIVAIVLYFQGKLRPRFDVARPLPSDRRAYLEAFAIYLGGSVALAVVFRYVMNLGGLWSAAALPFGFIVAVIWPRLRGQTWAEWRATVGFHAGKGFFRECAAGAVGYITGLPIFAIGFILTAILTSLAGANPSHPIERDISTNPATIIALLLLASVWAPITEELMFRGALFGHLRGRLGWWASAIPVCLIFAAIHPQGWTTIPALGSLALILAAIREWRGSILGSMTAHAINNTIVITALVLMIG
jgi:membrane protease YdiL (CAAX protease family)